MWRLMTLALCSALLLTLLSGCADREQKKLSRPPWVPKQATWPALEALANPVPEEGHAGLTRIFYRANGATDFSRAISSKLVEDFERTPIPDEFRNEEREAAKKELLDGLKEFRDPRIPPGKFKKLLERSRKAYETLKEIPGQKRPEGAEGEQYAPDAEIQTK